MSQLDTEAKTQVKPTCVCSKLRRERMHVELCRLSKLFAPRSLRGRGSVYVPAVKRYVNCPHHTSHTPHSPLPSPPAPPPQIQLFCSLCAHFHILHFRFRHCRCHPSAREWEVGMRFGVGELCVPNCVTHVSNLKSGHHGVVLVLVLHSSRHFNCKLNLKLSLAACKNACWMFNL